MGAFTYFASLPRPIYGVPEMSAYFRHTSSDEWTAIRCRVREIELRAYDEGGSIASISLPLERTGYFEGYTSSGYVVEEFDEVLIEMAAGPWIVDDKNVIFRGYVTNLVTEYDGKREEISVFCQGPEFLYMGWTCIGRNYASRTLISARTIFNENGAPNFDGISAGSYPGTSLADFGALCLFLGRNNPFYIGGAATLGYWNQAEMIAYVLGNFAVPGDRDDSITYDEIASMMTGWVPSEMPDFGSRSADDAYPEINIMGMSVADAISAIIATVPNVRNKWFITPEGRLVIFNVVTEDPSTYPPAGSGAPPAISVYLPLPGNSLGDLVDEEYVTRARINVDASRRFTEVDAYAGPKIFQTMVTLEKGWDTSLEAAVAGHPELLDRNSEDWDPTYKDVGRRYLLARTIEYEPGTSGTPLFSVAGEDNFAQEPRIILPQLISVFTPTGEDRETRHAVLVQRDKDGTWESIGGHIDPLFDATGIFIQSNPVVDLTPERIGNWDGNTTWYDLRLTFAIEADDLLYALGTSSHPQPNLTRFRAVDFGDGYKFNKVQHKNTYPQPIVEQPGTGEVSVADGTIVDDDARLAEDSDRMADRLNVNERSVSLQFGHFTTTYLPGAYIDYLDRPTANGEPDGAGDVTIGSTIVGVRFLFDGDMTTELMIADRRIAETS